MGKEDETILLSICIPTYNRAEILDKTIDTFFNDPAFDERVEIVISDNCSIDSTEEVVTKYLHKHRNIKYKKLPKNIGADLNVNIVLEMGEGLYLKTINDTISLKPGTLKYFLDIIDQSKNNLNPTFFYQNVSFLNLNQVVCCSNLNELVSNVSFYIGWLANFGIWRKDYLEMENKDRLAYLQFVQADLTIRLINKNKFSYFHFGDFYSIEELEHKGGYNIFQTFGVKYLSIYDEYINSELLKNKIFNTEKYRLFRYLLMGWYRTLHVKKNKKYSFGKDNAFKILMKNYRNQPYFYFGFLLLYMLLIFERIKQIIKR
jgi:abequosyltransferase